MISIVIPLYNNAETIRSTLENIVAQTFQLFEVIVVDDGSTDEGPRIVSKFPCDKIRLIEQLHQGTTAARNTGIRASRYPFIALLESEDKWKPNYLLTQSALLQQYPMCSVFACGYELQDADIDPVTIIIKHLPFTGTHGLLTNYFIIAATTCPPVSASSMVVRKEALLKIGGFPAENSQVFDLVTWAKLAVSYPIAYCIIPLVLIGKPAWYCYEEQQEQYREVHLKLLELKKYVDDVQLPAFKKYLGKWRDILKKEGRNAFSTLKHNGLTPKTIVYLLLSLMPAVLIRQRRKRQYRRK